MKKTEKAEEKPAEIIPEPVVEAVLETPLVVQEEKTEIQTENKGQPKAEVMDISFLIGGATPAKKEEESTPTLEKKTEENTAKKEEPKPVQKPQPQPQSNNKIMISKQGSTLHPQLQRIKIKIIIQVQSEHPPFPMLQPQSFPPKNLLNIVLLLNVFQK